MHVNKKMKFFGDRSIVAMLALLSAFPPLSTDLYLPALPHVAETLHTNQTLANLTLSVFLVFFALGILIWGPVSEKYGRKPILLTGLLLYTLGSAGCALSTNAAMLIVSRIVQGFGGGAAEAVATAMVKDMYSGRKRESVLAFVMAMVVVAPVVAPVAGAMILKFTTWDVIFWILTGIGVLSFLLSLRLDETLEQRYSGSIVHSLGRLGVVLKNPGFSVLLMVFSLIPLPLLAFIGVSAFIYIKGFGMTEQMYGYFFGLNALGSLVGPLLYIRISRLISPGNIIAGCMGILALTGIFLELKGSDSPVLFAAGMLTATVMVSMLRPPTANLLLSQQDKDTGSAASLINFTALFMGSLGMFLISFEQVSGLIPCLGLMQIIVGIVCGGLWLVLRHRPMIRQPG
nr:Bcr/CflA family efflux MFS transporter [uncultured Desulfobacter sp.]